MVITWFVMSGDNKWKCGTNMERVFWFITKGKENPTVSFLLFALPTNLATWHGQSQCEVPFLCNSNTPSPHTSVMGSSSHSCKLNPWCHFLLDDVMWWDCDCVAWRGIDIFKLSWSLFCPPLHIYIYFYILYIEYWQLVACSKMMPFLATCCIECK